MITPEVSRRILTGLFVVPPIGILTLTVIRTFYWHTILSYIFGLFLIIFSIGIFVFLYLAWVFYLYSQNPLAKKIQLPILDEILYALWILDWLFTPKCPPPPPRRPLTPVPQPLSAIPDPQLRGNEAYKRQRADEKRRGTIEAVPLAKAAPQTQSLFFNKLPIEVRRMIYHDVLGGTIHVEGDFGRFFHIRCSRKWEDRATETEVCWNDSRSMLHGFHYGSGTHDHPLPREQLAALLQTCHLVYGIVPILVVQVNSNPDVCSYAEAIDILYSSNSFDFPSAYSVLGFTEATLQQRLDSICSVKFYVSFMCKGYLRSRGYPQIWDDQCKNWERIWQITADMKSLQHVHATLKIEEERDTSPFHPIGEYEFFKPLRGVKGLKTFKLRINWPVYTSSVEMLPKSFELERVL